jgi:hypothetical protein
MFRRSEDTWVLRQQRVPIFEEEGAQQPAAERNHEFVIAALDRAKLRLLSVLIVGCAESHLKAAFRLDPSVKSVAILQGDHRSLAQVAGIGARRYACPDGKAHIMVRKLILLGECRGDTRTENGEEKYFSHVAKL